MPLTKDDREATDDPRRSIVERYASRADYLLRVVESLVELRRDRLLLDEDVAVLLDQAVGVSTLLGELRPIEEIAAERGLAAAEAVFDTMNAARAGSWTGTGPRAIVRALNSKGYGLMQSGKLSEALTMFELAVTLDPGNANAWDSLGECQMKMKNYKDAVSSFTKSLELDPDNTHAAAMIERVSSGLVTDRPFQ